MPEIEYLTMTELESFEEELASSFNAEADANASVPPFPKGVYVFSLKFQEDDPDKRWVQKMKEDTKEKYYFTNIVAEIAENPANSPDYVGRKVFANAMTLVMKNTGTTSAQAIIQAMGEGDKLLTMPRTHQTQIKLLNSLLANGTLCGAETDWEANEYDKEKKVTKFRLRGMNSFPKFKDGTPIPVAIDDHGGEHPARCYVKRWLTLEQVEELLNKAEEVEDAEGGADEGEAEEAAAAAPPAPPARTAPATRPAPAAAAPAPAKPPARRPVPVR
jgi:hypothetical protein